MSALEEKVARVIHRTYWPDRSEAAWDHFSEEYQGLYRRIARAAISVVLTEMEEPSEDMLMAAQKATAGWLNLDREGSGLTQALMKHRIRFQAMLSAFCAGSDGEE